jgi:hypothetical protein
MHNQETRMVVKTLHLGVVLYHRWIQKWRNAYIYSKQQQQQNRDVALKLCICMAFDNL